MGDEVGSIVSALSHNQVPRHITNILHRQGVGVLSALDQHLATLEETNQDFLSRTLFSTHDRLSGLFKRFVDEQVRSIEDTKVKIKKRKGVIGFIKVFPSFSACIENMMVQDGAHEHERHETRVMVDEAYGKINKAMFESLKVIAKEAPGAVGAGADPEDKEALNYHILLIENMNHYVEELDERGDPVLSEWRASAQAEGNEHLALYVDAVIRRPLGRIIVRTVPSSDISKRSRRSSGKLTFITGLPRAKRAQLVIRRRRALDRLLGGHAPQADQHARRQGAAARRGGAEEARRQALWRRRRPGPQPQPRAEGAEGVRGQV